MASLGRIDEIIELVRADGGRATPARRTILRALLDHPSDHPTAEEVAAGVHIEHPDIAESTVYRFLVELGRLGVVRPVRIGDGPTAYHLAEASHHHHLRCIGCAAMIEIPHHTLAKLRDELLTGHGFELRVRHVTLDGFCSRCRQTAEAGEH